MSLSYHSSSFLTFILFLIVPHQLFSSHFFTTLQSIPPFPHNSSLPHYPVTLLFLIFLPLLITFSSRFSPSSLIFPHAFLPNYQSHIPPTFLFLITLHHSFIPHTLHSPSSPLNPSYPLPPPISPLHSPLSYPSRYPHRRSVLGARSRGESRRQRGSSRRRGVRGDTPKANAHTYIHMHVGLLTEIHTYIHIRLHPHIHCELYGNNGLRRKGE